MSKRSLQLIFAVLIAALVLTALALSAALLLPHARLPGGAALTPVRFEGEIVSQDGSMPVPLTREALQKLRDADSLTVRGRLLSDVPAGNILMLHLCDVRARLFINGREALSFGWPQDGPAIARSPGEVWYSFSSPGISVADSLELRVERVYERSGAAAYDEAFFHMYTGSSLQLFAVLFRESGGIFLFGALSCSLSVLVLAIAIVARCFSMPYVRPMLLFSGASLSAGLWMLFGFEGISLLMPYPAFNAMAACAGLYAFPVFLSLYCLTFLTAWRKKAVAAVGIAQVLFLMCSVLLTVHGAVDMVEFRPAAAILLPTEMLLGAVLLYLERERPETRARTHLMLLSVLPLAVGTLADGVNHFMGGESVTVGFDVSFLFFAVMQVGMLMRALQENARRSVQLERDLLESRVTMMLSQIRPHFLYNSLTAIKQLCATDPAAAEDAVGYFANYLRCNLDSLSKNTLIPLSREIAHTECYLRLERMRFGERVKVVYDLRYSAFSLPSLTLQPLVENAVRYGITKKREGGTITIFADETDKEYVVRVSDDGVGFDPSGTISGDDRSHIGLQNVRSRVAAMCEGTLEIASAPGKGTIATICIPKRDASGED